LVYRRRWEVGKSDSEEDEDDGHDSFTVSEEDNSEEGKKHFMDFVNFIQANILWYDL
jgi:hypothetical protein